MRAAAIAIATAGGLVSMACGPAVADDPRATADGGSSTTGSLFQQNAAQNGRQNNNCSSVNEADSALDLAGGRLRGRCVTTDGSLNKFSEVHTGSADAMGGSRLDGSLTQQNVAQRGRQNNNCANPNDVDDPVDGIIGSRLVSQCTDEDVSFSEHTYTRGRGATAQGGAGSREDQNIAQTGRQNNNCANPNLLFFDTFDSSRLEARCGNKDRSASKHAWVDSGGARAEGGSTAGGIRQQNIAQEGRQNNNCGDAQSPFIIASGSRLEGRCGNTDGSINTHTRDSGDGAEASGGSASSEAIGSLSQQNIAQEGRQNNNCASPNVTDFGIESFGGSRSSGGCANTDLSLRKETRHHGGGAVAEGGSGDADIDQQNIAQEGRQNNNCANPNSVGIDAAGSAVNGHCSNKDLSYARQTWSKGGGSQALGGSSGLEVDQDQQNIAQSGRQNNNCANPNEGDVTLTGGRAETRCGTLDRSATVRSTEIGGRATAEGGSSTGGSLFQQNTAQDGRQSNNCGNPNNLDLTLSGGRASTQCQAVDASRSTGSIYR
ncbi:hypothetical protein [Streptomyces sp. NPDC047108]|uniref:hypothetical protein n=1 Tax=Streptomyces sp. NPDC047108 TaxID=3155025 RepID=UPI0033D3C0A5